MLRRQTRALLCPWPAMRWRTRDAEVSPDGESFETEPPLAWLPLVVGPPALLFACEARAGGTVENVKHTTRKDLQTCLPTARHKRRAGIRNRGPPCLESVVVVPSQENLTPTCHDNAPGDIFFLWVSSPGAPPPRPPGWSQVRIVMGRRAAGEPVEASGWRGGRAATDTQGALHGWLYVCAGRSLV